MSVTLDLGSLERDVPRDARLTIDTSAAIAYLHGGERASPAAAWVFDGCLATGRNQAVISAVTVAELMVGPSKAGPTAIATMEGFFRFFADVRVAPFDEPLARAAARIRATTGLALPDAAVVATALEHGAAIIVTNDARWPRALGASSIPIAVCLLDAYGAMGFGELLGRRGRLAAAEGWDPDAVGVDVRRAVAEVRSSRPARRR